MQQRGLSLAILLGASEYPNYSSLDASPAFLNSKNDFFDYLKSNAGLGLPDERILDLFDSKLHPGQIISLIRDFLIANLASTQTPIDVLFYYCGHGAYLNEKEYFLALACSSKHSKEATVFKIGYLVSIINDLTSECRNLVILDACYSGGALTEFGHMDAEENATDVLSAQFEPISYPDEIFNQSFSRGVMLFCAAGPKKWAKTPLESRHTMFSGALLGVLQRGDTKSGPYLTIRRLAELMRTEIKSAFGSQGVQPQIHVPVQGESDLIEVLYFPNLAFDIHAFDNRLSKVETVIVDIQTLLRKRQNIELAFEKRLLTIENLYSKKGLSELTNPQIISSDKEILDAFQNKVLILFATGMYSLIVTFLTWLPFRLIFDTPIIIENNPTGHTLIFAFLAHFVLAVIGIIKYSSKFSTNQNALIHFIGALVPPYLAPWVMIWISILFATFLGYLLLIPSSTANSFIGTIMQSIRSAP